jgi:ubiquinone/menaquinone biosynthesis C-methylase UbiE
MKRLDEIAHQRSYYSDTAGRYDDMHVDQRDEHHDALDWLSAIIAARGYTSVLDVGSGTGRAPLYLKGRTPAKVIGVEPVAELREIGHQKGLAPDELVDGDALALPFPDNSFDVVCEFGVLHHIRDHGRAVAEMCRVARKGVFISDSNNFGQGSGPARLAKQAINAVGMWPLFYLLKTRGKGYRWSEGDGVSYSYSVFTDVPAIRRQFPAVRMMSTRPTVSPSLYRGAETVAIFASDC